MLTDGSAHLRTADSASKYIKRWKSGSTTIKAQTSHEVMLAELVDARIGEIEAHMAAAAWHEQLETAASGRGSGGKG